MGNGRVTGGQLVGLATPGGRFDAQMLRYGKPRKLRRHGKLSKYYYVRVSDSETGARPDVSTGCTSKAAAEAWVRAKEAEQQTRAVAEANRLPGSDPIAHEKCPGLRAAAEAWLESLGDRSRRHLLTSESRARYWVAHFGDTPLDRITTEDIERYRRLRMAAKIRHDPEVGPSKLTKTAANSDLRALRALFGFSIRREWMTINRAANVRMLKEVHRERSYHLSEADERKLLDACRSAESLTVSGKRNANGRKGGKSTAGRKTWKQSVAIPDYLEPFVVVALYSGLRRSALLRIQWLDIDLRSGRWAIPGEKMKAGVDYREPASPVVVRALTEYRERLRERAKGRGESSASRLAPSATVFGLPETAEVRAFRTAVKRAGLRLAFHDLRRIFLNRLGEAKVPLETAMRLAASNDVKTVLKYYRAPSESSRRDAIDQLKKPDTASG